MSRFVESLGRLYKSGKAKLPAEGNITQEEYTFIITQEGEK